MTAELEKNQIIALLTFSIIFFDQVSKYIVGKLGEVNACNKGIAFGVGEISPVTTFAVLAVLFFFLLRERNYLSKIGLAIILAGGFSNLLDRIFVGCVRDFIAVVKLPSFNLADSAITIGVFVLVYGLVKASNEAEDYF